MMIRPDLIGDAHYTDRGRGIKPFTVEQLDTAKGDVHVFDDTSLDIVMRTLDTVSDFVSYLTKKEQFIRVGRARLPRSTRRLGCRCAVR